MKLRTALLLVGLPLGVAPLSLTMPDAAAQTLTNLHSFVRSPTDGLRPYARLVQGRDGNFYGTTSAGGASPNCDLGCGTVFRISPDGSYTNIYSFGGTDTNLPSSSGYPDNGYSPYAGLIQGRDGNFYGTTYLGGTSTNCSKGCGIVFRISPCGAYTNLHSFGDSPNDGGNPYAALVQSSNGDFYGTTRYGGTYGNGIVFRISSTGSYTNLYAFGSSPSDGANPYAGLVQGRDGYLYGTAYAGGTHAAGTIFRISPSGTYTNLYSLFSHPTYDGMFPYGGLVEGNDGNFYGTTIFSGKSLDGVVFRITPDGSYTNLYFFDHRLGDGSRPRAALVQGSDGNFYGTTEKGGRVDEGTVFRISPSGSYTNLQPFFGYEGIFPYAELVQGSDGNFYGTTSRGGTNFYGNVFKLTVPLNPPANQVSGIQMVHNGKHAWANGIAISIPSVAGETYRLQYRYSLSFGKWRNVYGVQPTKSIGGMLTVTNFGGAIGPQGFYRFDITP